MFEDKVLKKIIENHEGEGSFKFSEDEVRLYKRSIVHKQKIFSLISVLMILAAVGLLFFMYISLI